MAYANDAIKSRIEWCRRQRSQSQTALEREGWCAEEQGLLDAILKADHSNEYKQCPAATFERYEMGLQDGQVLIHFQSMNAQFGARSQ